MQQIKSLCMQTTPGNIGAWNALLSYLGFLAPLPFLHELKENKFPCNLLAGSEAIASQCSTMRAPIHVEMSWLL